VVVDVRCVVRRLLGLGALALALPGAAAAQQGNAILFANGKSLYAENCLSCHGVGGRGVPRPTRGALDVHALGPRLRGVGAQAADFYLRTGYMPLESALDQPTRRHSPFTAKQIDALVAYVSSFGGPKVPKPHPERGGLAVGLRLYTEHCAGCHQVVGEGGYVTGARVPPLKQATATQIAEAVRVGPYLMPRFPKTQISDRQLDSIVRYVEWAKHPDDRGGWGIGHIGPVPEGLVAWLFAGAALVGVCTVIGSRIKS
jgi:ubiquinol-cytochrome c reductase cytochrome c subunit